MALGPRLDIRQSQSLVMTPQLTQAIRLLQLSNLELEAVIAEELSKNPLLESAGGEESDDSASAGEAQDDFDSDEAPEEPGADDLMQSLGASEDQPLDMDWQAEALETDSVSDATSGSGGE